MVHVELMGFIGNNLFHYAVARILSEELGYELKVTHSLYRPGKNVPQFKALMSVFRDAPLSVPGRAYHHPEDRTAYLGHEGFGGQRLDLGAMLRNREPRCIRVKGLFERYEIFRPHKNRIRAWYKVDPITQGHNIGPDDVVMHVRRGDVIIFGRALALSYYTDLLDRLDFHKLYICGVGLDPEVKKAFEPYHPTYVQGDPVADFRFMKGFNRIIQSQSTFSWWASFLSEAEEIYAPVMRPASLKSSSAPAIDLRVDDEPRYHHVIDAPRLERGFNIADVFRARHQLVLRHSKHIVFDWSKRGCKATLAPAFALWRRIVG